MHTGSIYDSWQVCVRPFAPDGLAPIDAAIVVALKDRNICSADRLEKSIAG